MLFKNYIKIIYLNLFLQYTLDYTKKKKKLYVNTKYQ